LPVGITITGIDSNSSAISLNSWNWTELEILVTNYCEEAALNASGGAPTVPLAVPSILSNLKSFWKDINVPWSDWLAAS